MLNTLVERLGYRTIAGLGLASALILTRNPILRVVLFIGLAGYLAGVYLASRGSGPTAH